MSEINRPPACEQFEAAVSDYIDGARSAGESAVMEAHAAGCVRCSALLTDVQAIVREARALPSLPPSRDLWAGIAERLDTPVVGIEARGAVVSSRTPVTSFFALAAAAVLLVAASSGVTWVLARGNSHVVLQPVASAALPQPAHAVPSDPVLRVPEPPRVARAQPAIAAPLPRERGHFASAGNEGVELVYEREINAMRRIVDERLIDLDSVTVVEIERNLRIIDRAINDSRRALENDPRSRFLATQLDRALGNKLDVLRRIALL